MDRRFLFIGVLALVLVAGFFIYNNQSTDPGAPASVEPETGPSEMGVMVSGPTINNDLWGRVTEIEYTGNYVVLQAFPVDGYQFNYWTNMDGSLISSDIGDYSSTTLRVPVDKDRPYIAVFGEAGQVSREYTWVAPAFNPNGTVSYTGEKITFSVSLNTRDYQTSIGDASIQRSAGAVSSPVSLCDDGFFVRACVGHLEPYVDGMSNLKKAITILAFVQDIIGYETDSNQYNRSEFWATPMEILYSGMGDCEDTALLFVSIAELMGVDCGFVTFGHDVSNTPDSGHMSIAVALKGTENISGGNTFVYRGVTYAYGETAFDPTGEYDNYHPTIGELGDNYHLRDGIFTPITYSEEDGFRALSSIAISGVSGTESGSIIYGAETDYSHPPTVEMCVGDSFSYAPQTNLPCTFTAEGNGMTFLTFDGTTLKGVADRTGFFVVYITATTTVGPEQTAVQTITLNVSEATDKISENQLVYGANGWELVKSETPVYSGDDDAADSDDEQKKEGVKDKLLIAILILFVASIGLAIFRWRL